MKPSLTYYLLLNTNLHLGDNLKYHSKTNVYYSYLLNRRIPTRKSFLLTGSARRNRYELGFAPGVYQFNNPPAIGTQARP